MDTQLVPNAVSLLWITILSIQDILYMKISKRMTYAFVISGALVSLINRTPTETALSAVPGLILLIICYTTKESLGYGDAITTVGLGLWVGMRIVCVSLFVGIGLSLVGSIIYMFIEIKGLSGKKSIPFIPFLMLGQVVSYAGG
ncbi:MAG: A24 family peptidase [Lachnospiraceae bacterium]|nr:A24 family peptidase [Lachnospiraceae bacterium]